MTGRERFNSLIRNRQADRTGFWLGNPHKDALPMYTEYFGVKSHLELSQKLSDDFRWITADSCWHHPENQPIFDPLGGKTRESLNQDGIFADTEDVAEVEKAPWPDPKYIDLDELEKKIDETHEKTGMAVASGTWSCFFHNVADFFGMENYFVKMYENPDVVEAVTEKIVDFYYEANDRVFKRMANKIDVFFLGNDFGSQLDLLVSPECFRKFVLPSFKRLIDLAKGYGIPVMLHSCGAISKAIPDLIDAGIDALHPLQAKARGMDAESLAQFKNDILFVGGVDTQQILPFGTPDEVRNEVHRVKKILGPGLVVSPSHEALLPNVSPQNLEAMYQAAMED